MPVQSHRYTIKHFSLACAAAVAAHQTIEALFAKSECLWIIVELKLHLVLLLYTFLLLSLAHIVDALDLELS